MPKASQKPRPLQERPGANLRRMLEAAGRDLTEFAVEVNMGTDPRHALANIRRYTHAKSPKWPTAELVERWAAALNVDPSEFYGP